MLSFTGGLKVFVALEPVDLRKSFSGLEGLVSDRLKEDLREGALFVFTNRSHTRLKILYWDRDGYAMWYKRLEKGSFRFPIAATASATKGVEVKAADLMMILDGVDLGSVRRQRRYERQPA